MANSFLENKTKPLELSGGDCLLSGVFGSGRVHASWLFTIIKAMGARNEKRKSGRKRGEAQSGSAAAPVRPRRVLSGRASLWSEAVEGRVLVSAPEGAERRG